MLFVYIEFFELNLLLLFDTVSPAKKGDTNIYAKTPRVAMSRMRFLNFGRRGGRNNDNI